MHSKTSQVHLTIPVFIYGHSDSGDRFKEMTRTLTIDANGGCVELEASVSKERPLLVVNIGTGQFVSCRVASIKKGMNGKAHVGIYFALPSPRFWGVEFPSDEMDHAALNSGHTEL